MPLLKLPSASVHYLDEGQGPPLILLHANPGDAQDYAAVRPVLAQHFRVFTLDWPGYGLSPMPADPGAKKASFFFEILLEFVQALGAEPVCVIGNSVGGNAAARLAIHSPHLVRGLVLVSPGGFTPHNGLTRAFCRWMGSAWGLRPHAWASLYLKHRTPVTRAMLERAATVHSEPRRLVLNRAIWRNFAQPDHDLRGQAARIVAPTLLMFGRHDPAIAAKKDGRVAARLLPHARMEVLPCGHAPFAEVPDLFLSKALPFLQDCACAADGVQSILREGPMQRAG